MATKTEIKYSVGNFEYFRMKPVHQDSIEEPSSAVEDTANGSNKREKVIVGNETLAKSFVEARH